MKRTLNYIIDFTVNGLIGLLIFYTLQYSFLSFSPSSWYFEYYSVEPVSVPVDITKDSIRMESNLANFREGNLVWNDVLRCRDKNGNYSYVGQSDTSASTVLVNEDQYVSRWTYRGEMPEEPTVCRMDSTITRDLEFGIEKRQFISSHLFKVE